MSIEEGALCEPLSVALQAVKRTGVPRYSDRGDILVLGAGTIGLLCALVAKREPNSSMNAITIAGMTNS